MMALDLSLCSRSRRAAEPGENPVFRLGALHIA